MKVIEKVRTGLLLSQKCAFSSSIEMANDIVFFSCVFAERRDNAFARSTFFLSRRQTKVEGKKSPFRHNTTNEREKNRVLSFDRSLVDVYHFVHEMTIVADNCCVQRGGVIPKKCSRMSFTCHKRIKGLSLYFFFFLPLLFSHSFIQHSTQLNTHQPKTTQSQWLSPTFSL